MALSAVKEPLNTTQIHTKGQIYEISATLKAALEHRLKCEGYFEGNDMKNMSLYSITPRGRKLLKGWIAFYQPIHKITWQYGINLTDVVMKHYKFNISIIISHSATIIIKQFLQELSSDFFL